METGNADNVVEVSFQPRGRETATAGTPMDAAEEHEIRAMRACLRQLQEQAAALDRTTAAHLMGVAALALEEAAVDGEGRA